jgi:hypothetical protein
MIFDEKDDIDDKDDTDDKDNTADKNKKIHIQGTHNRYQIKKCKREEVVQKKRKTFSQSELNEQYFQEEKQELLLEYLCRDWLMSEENEDKTETRDFDVNLLSILNAELKKKLASYRSQDMKKKKYNEAKFVTLEAVIQRLKECRLSCFYCKEKTFLLYDLVRESKQWTLDRINNDIGHESDNIIISCLECNLKRRRQSKDAFVFTRQLVIEKLDLNK